MKKFLSILKRRAIYGGLLLPAFSVSVFAVPTDETRLPPAASVKIDFARDIQPIFESSCLRCHGPEKPKSRFRLDNRASAIKGGENGVDILPGNSAKSPLIRYVAGLEDIPMPPKGKGKPLTEEQIGLLRAWIDQGAAWGTDAGAGELAFSLAPTLRWITVSGDEHKFRELYWQREGWNGGIEEFELKEQINADTRVITSGHVLNDDYKLQLTLEKEEVGFIHSGWEQYRKYYNDRGGYYPLFNPSSFTLGRDLHYDMGRAWIDFGLNLPNWPQIVLGYEYQYANGEKSTLQWGDVVQNGIARKIYPASKNSSERTHIIKFDLDYEVAGVLFEDSFRGEFYRLHTRQTNIVYAPFIGTFTGENVEQGYHHFQGANVIRLEKQFTDWFFGSGGYLYSKLNADAAFTLNTMNISGPALGDLHWRGPEITLERDSHVFNLNGLLGPWDGLTISSGVQSEWTRQTGFGPANFDLAFPGGFFLAVPATLNSDLDKNSVQENIAVRYAKIPFTALYAEGRLQQEHIGQFEQQKGGDQEFLRNTLFANQMTDFRAGFNTSPWQSVSLAAHYRRYDSDSRYRHTRDEQPINFPGIGYSAFIRARDLLTDEVETKLVLHPLTWFQSTLSYRIQSTRYRTDTAPVPGGISPGGGLLAGKYDAHIYSLNATLAPHQRLYLSPTFSYQDSTTTTFANGSPAIAPYRGDIYSALLSATYVLNQATDLIGTYSFSYADYSQGNFIAGLPLGIRYQQQGIQGGLTRRFGKNLTTKLQYGYFLYDEPTSGGANNFRAQAILGTLTYRFH